jgi:hypothetical protein
VHHNSNSLLEAVIGGAALVGRTSLPAGLSASVVGQRKALEQAVMGPNESATRREEEEEKGEEEKEEVMVMKVDEEVKGKEEEEEEEKEEKKLGNELEENERERQERRSAGLQIGYGKAPEKTGAGAMVGTCQGTCEGNLDYKWPCC